MTEILILEVREARGLTGRVFKRLFWGFQLVTVLAMLATCALVGPYLGAEDPEVVMGAGMFGAVAVGSLWVLWPLGSLVLGVLYLVTRGRKRLIQAPLPGQRSGSVPDTLAERRR